MGLGSAMAGGNPNPDRGREKDDFYSTPPDVTQALIDAFPFKITYNGIWEPCAGVGAMSDLLQGSGYRVFASDIVQRRDDIAQLDFLATKKILPDFDTVVTNPPFKLAEQMIRHSFDIGAKTVVMLLKSTFWHAAGRQDLWKRHQPTFVMPLTWRPDFQNLGRPTMEIAWHFFESHHHANTRYIPLSRPKGK